MLHGSVEYTIAKIDGILARTSRLHDLMLVLRAQAKVGFDRLRTKPWDDRVKLEFMVAFLDGYACDEKEREAVDQLMQKVLKADHDQLTAKFLCLHSLKIPGNIGLSWKSRKICTALASKAKASTAIAVR